MDHNLPTPCINPEGQEKIIDDDDLIQDVETLSPNTRRNLENVVYSLKKGEATLELKDGKPHLQYKASPVYTRDSSETNTIGMPNQLEGCLRLLDFFVSEKSPSGIVFDTSKISLSQGKLYREGIEFEDTGSIIGKGINGDIIVIKDKKTGTEHAQKTVMITTCAKNEVRCWVDLNDSNHVPKMFMFRIDKNRVKIHMEIIKGKTLTSIMDEHMTKLRTPGHEHLVKPFSLYVLGGALDAISAMHKKGLTHNDVHGGNLMCQDSNMKLKIIDFGSAECIESENEAELDEHCKRREKDIIGLLRIFMGLYTDDLLKSANDFRKNYGDVIQRKNLSESDRLELISLIDTAVKYGNINKLRQDVRQQLHNVAKQLFPEWHNSIRISEKIQLMETQEKDDEDEAECYSFDTSSASAQASGPHDSVDDLDDIVGYKLLEEIRGALGIGLAL